MFLKCFSKNIFATIGNHVFLVPYDLLNAKRLFVTLKFLGGTQNQRCRQFISLTVKRSHVSRNPALKLFFFLFNLFYLLIGIINTPNAITATFVRNHTADFSLEYETLFFFAGGWCWKQPFWVRCNENIFSNHIFHGNFQLS
jgi:hypothetical protein